LNPVGRNLSVEQFPEEDHPDCPSRGALAEAYESMLQLHNTLAAKIILLRREAPKAQGYTLDTKKTIIKELINY
jgi:hypothetical protein